MRFKLIALAAAGLVASGAALAGPSPQTTTFDVTAYVSDSCVIDSANLLRFGRYDPVGVQSTNTLSATSAINVRCTRGTTAAVSFSEGLHKASGSSCAAPLRQMKASNDSRTNLGLPYTIHQDQARSQVWGCADSTSQSFTSTTALTPTTLTVYGRIPAGQDLPVGEYSDTITVDVVF